MTLTGKTSDSSFLPKRIPEIDGLRGIAILGVLAFHLFGEGINYEQSHWLINCLAEISKYGANGVALFFVISGFLIGGILIDNHDSPNYFKTFYVRRIFRIFPLYYGLIVIFYILSHANSYHLILIPEWMLGFTFSSKWYLIFAQNFPMVRDGNLGTGILAPTWSLAVEEQFYLTLPFIIRFVPRKFLTSIILALFGGATIFRAIIWYQTSSLFATKFLMPSCLDLLMIGVLIAILLRFPKSLILMERYGLKLLIAVFLILMICLSILSNLVLKYSPKLEENPFILVATFLSLIYGLLLILAVISKPKEIINKILCNRILRKFGELSYFIYLFHIGIYFFISWQMGITTKPPFGMIWFVEVGLTLLITFVLAQLSFEYFEKPLIDYGHKFKYEN
ncbi:MAG TPA: acyltransferase [Pyrinomonadaceae bacterium]|nr:acyltransferase [Pyrinomonadaceae bacterium]